LTKNSVMNNQRSKKDSTALSSKELFIFGGALAVYLFYRRSLNRIINYPDSILYLLGGIIFVIIFLYSLPKLRNEMNSVDNLPGKVVAVAIRVLSAAIFSWFVTGILLIPFNYYDIHAAQGNSSEAIYCPVTGLTANAKDNSIIYEFGGSSHILYGSSTLMNEIYSKGNYKEYQLRLTVKKALFGSYFLEDWDLYKR
jgi:hypothetical protein